MITVDGTHCNIEEPSPWSPIWFSHKSNAAAVNYELGILIHKPQIVWVRGPTPPGLFQDATVFKQALMDRLPTGRKAIGDDGYKQEDLFDHISTENDMDPREVAEFKANALSRHEKVNGLLKNFRCFVEAFRHDHGLHECCFKACCAIINKELKNGSISLFDPYPDPPSMETDDEEEDDVM